MKFRSIHAYFPLTLVAGLAILSPGRPGVAQVAGQAPRIIVGRETQVSVAHEKRPHAEVALVADPVDPGRLLAGSDAMNPELGTSVVAYASADGGKTWVLTLEKKAAEGGLWYGDLSVAFGPDGAAYLTAQFSGGLGMELVSSRDGGRTWGAPVVFKQIMDRPFLIADCTDGRLRGRVYCACGWETPAELAVYRSRDGARTFDPPTRLLARGSAQGIVPGRGAVLSDGTLVVPYSVLIKATGPLRSLRVRRSDDGGETFLGEQSLRDYRDKADEPPHRLVGWIPNMDVDRSSGPFKDRIYLVWFERSEAGTRVMLMLSRDKGVNWSHPVAISDEAGVDAEDKATRRFASRPSVAVNRAGVVAIVWYDVTLRGGTLNSEVRLRASLDGGSTWLPGVRVTEFVGRNDPEAAESWLGHTSGLAADASGTFHPLWVDNRTGVRQVFTTTVVVK